MLKPAAMAIATAVSMRTAAAVLGTVDTAIRQLLSRTAAMAPCQALKAAMMAIKFQGTGAATYAISKASAETAHLKMGKRATTAATAIPATAAMASPAPPYLWDVATAISAAQSSATTTI